MGDSYTLSGLKCGHCGKRQNEVYYGESSGFLSHTCKFCKKPNIIISSFSLKAATKKEVERHYKLNGFE